MGTSKTRHIQLFRNLLEAPERAVEDLDLVYVNYEEFPIIRVPRAETFQYLLADQPLSDPEHLERIESLVIPPAWKEVRITELPNGHLQAVGRDRRKRRQYRYHPLWMEVRNQTKFYKMIRFGERLPKIRKMVEEHLDLDGWPREKVLALVVRLMEETHIRIGNEQYARRNKTYGLSTLRSRHLKSFKDKIRFEFTGKRGKKHRVTLRNKKLIRLVNRCEEIPGWELFKFFDEDGNKRTIDSGLINTYIQELAGSHFSAKDFRTWGASLLYFEFLLDAGAGTTEKERDKISLRAYDHSAAALGNTRKVCREYYVHPALPELLGNGQLQRKQEEVSKQERAPYFTAAETCMLEVIRSYQPAVLPS